MKQPCKCWCKCNSRYAGFLAEHRRVRDMIFFFCLYWKLLLFISVYWQVLIPCFTQKRRPTSSRSSWGICCHRQWTVTTDTPDLWPRRPAARWWSGSSSPGLCISPTHRCVKSTHTQRNTRPDSYILHAQSDPICTQSVDHLLPHSVEAQAIFPLIYLSSLFPFPSFLPNSPAYETITAYIVDD